jgi:hypothetical protein
MKTKGLISVLLSILLVTPLMISLLGVSPSEAAPGPQGDYGDAPDDTLFPGNVFAYPGVVAHFPSLYDTNNSRIPGRKGAYNVGPFEAWLSRTSNVLSTTTESEAKLVNADEDDADPILYIDKTTNTGFIVVRVVVAPTAPDVVRYINVLIDQNRDGEWRNEPNNPEWVGINQPVRAPPGEARNVIIGPIPLRSDFTIPVWTRISLTNDIIDSSDFDTYAWGDTFFEKNGWDGSAPSGGFSGGETEDYLFENSDNVPGTDLKFVCSGLDGGLPIDPVNVKFADVVGYGDGWGITKEWFKTRLDPDEIRLFYCEIRAYGNQQVTINAPPRWIKAWGLVNVIFTYVRPNLPVVIAPGQTVKFWFTAQWENPDALKSAPKFWCGNGIGFYVSYYAVFTYDPIPADPFEYEIEDMLEGPTPVGGVAFSPDKLALLAPYIILAALIAIASVSVAVYWRKYRK